MKGAVWLLCVATAFLCSTLLYRGFRRSGTKLLLWCSLFFLSLAVENAVLFIDLIVVPATDLFALRTSIALVGVTLLLVGLVWEAT